MSESAQKAVETGVWKLRARMLDDTIGGYEVSRDTHPTFEEALELVKTQVGVKAVVVLVKG